MLYVKETLRLNNRGATLIQLMVGVGLAAIVSLGIASVLNFSGQEQKKVQTRTELLSLKNRFSELLHQQQTILNTISASENANMACLRERTTCPSAHVASTYSPTHDRIVIYNSGGNGGNLFYNGLASSTSGFTEKGAAPH